MASPIFVALDGFVTNVDGIDYTVSLDEHRSGDFPPVKAVPHLWRPFSDSGASAVAAPLEAAGGKDEPAPEAPAKRGPGRPRKNPAPAAE